MVRHDLKRVRIIEKPHIGVRLTLTILKTNMNWRDYKLIRSLQVICKHAMLDIEFPNESPDCNGGASFPSSLIRVDEALNLST